MSAKPVLSYFAEKIPAIPETAAKSVCEFALLRIQGRIVSFEEQVCLTRRMQGIVGLARAVIDAYCEG